MSVWNLQDDLGMILERIDGGRTLEHKLLHIHTRNVCCSCTFVEYSLLGVLATGAFPLPPLRKSKCKLLSTSLGPQEVN